jgi:hypothetical protein
MLLVIIVSDLLLIVMAFVRGGSVAGTNKHNEVMEAHLPKTTNSQAENEDE